MSPCSSRQAVAYRDAQRAAPLPALNGCGPDLGKRHCRGPKVNALEVTLCPEAAIEGAQVEGGRSWGDQLMTNKSPSAVDGLSTPSDAATRPLTCVSAA